MGSSTHLWHLDNICCIWQVGEVQKWESFVSCSSLPPHLKEQPKKVMTQSHLQGGDPVTSTNKETLLAAVLWAPPQCQTSENTTGIIFMMNTEVTFPATAPHLSPFSPLRSG